LTAFPGTILKSLAVLIFYLIAADIIGVIACFLFDVAPLRYDSGALPYAIWFLLGVFTGFIVLGAAGDWASAEGRGDWDSRPGAARTANIVVATSFAAMLALAAFFNHIYWSRGVAGEYFVPDSAPHTITFFVSILLAMLIGRHALVERPKE
jgi:hypothetical protein